MYDTSDKISADVPTPAGAISMLCDTIKITQNKIKLTADNSGGMAADPAKLHGMDATGQPQYSDPAILKRDAETFQKTVADGFKAAGNPSQMIIRFERPVASIDDLCRRVKGFPAVESYLLLSILGNLVFNVESKRFRRKDPTLWVFLDEGVIAKKNS